MFNNKCKNSNNGKLLRCHIITSALPTKSVRSKFALQLCRAAWGEEESGPKIHQSVKMNNKILVSLPKTHFRTARHPFPLTYQWVTVHRLPLSRWGEGGHGVTSCRGAARHKSPLLIRALREKAWGKQWI